MQLSKEDQAILESYKAYKSTYSGKLPFQAYYNFVTNWDIHPVEHLEKVVGAVFTKDSNIHVAVNGTWFPRRYIKRIVLPMLEKYGIINTTVDIFNETGLAWVMKLGFKLVDKNHKQYILVLKKDDLCLS